MKGALVLRPVPQPATVINSGFARVLSPTSALKRASYQVRLLDGL
jgi:hypothetical protein